jgi:hypothetical protein
MRFCVYASYNLTMAMWYFCLYVKQKGRWDGEHFGYGD